MIEKFSLYFLCYGFYSSNVKRLRIERVFSSILVDFVLWSIYPLVNSFLMFCFPLDISVIMESPSDPGIYQSKWRMSTMTGNFFGWVNNLFRLRMFPVKPPPPPHIIIEACLKKRQKFCKKNLKCWKCPIHKTVPL